MLTTAHKGEPQLHGIELTVKCNLNFHNPVKPLKMPILCLGPLLNFTLP